MGYNNGFITQYHERENAKGHPSFERMALPHMNYLLHFAYRMCRNWPLAEDLVQETLLIGMEKFDQLKDERKCRSWLTTIMRNLFLRMRHRERKKYKGDFDDLSRNLQDVSMPVQRHINQPKYGDVLETLQSLGQKYRLPLTMAVIEGFSYQEIADHLDIPIGTVMSRIHRGKRVLREGMEQTDLDDMLRMASLNQQ